MHFNNFNSALFYIIELYSINNKNVGMTNLIDFKSQNTKFLCVRKPV